MPTLNYCNNPTFPWIILLDQLPALTFVLPTQSLQNTKGKWVLPKYLFFPVLKTFQWFPISFWVIIKVFRPVYKVLYYLAPFFSTTAEFLLISPYSFPVRMTSLLLFKHIKHIDTPELWLCQECFSAISIHTTPSLNPIQLLLKCGLLDEAFPNHSI